MTEKFLRNKVDGFIYRWHPVLAANPKCEEVTEEQAFPEKFLPKRAVKRVQEKAAARGGLDLTTEDVPEEPDQTPPELAVEAGRGWPKSAK